ncbi:hypothetical protein [Sphingobacterium wenxiniae]|uniref:CarboxypepD_reg-like domain-containing protein n=1 Tax=Sphingobacterium wenxiniae TaxID=683125 RepID=A0A1I6SEN7_9SPHI|nr:hypothetical protein [Sphingobacterium wenxiniae]SFS75384.1 hypothetical protein SAMN05660206_104254 [Sphingobacterium wenxiniae]
MNILRNISVYLILLLPFSVLGQAKTVQGIVFDKGTKQRIGKVFIKNDQTKDNIYNNARGEFEIRLREGDAIIATKEGYFPDTIVYSEEKVLMFHMERSSIYIPEVQVVARKSPEEILKQRREEFNKAYRLADPGSIFSVGPTGAGLSISTIYNFFSREGKNAKRLTRIIQQEYENNVIDSKFTRELVQKTTGLKGEHLENFMSNYRPNYYFILAASPYELTEYIKSKYEIFKLNPNLRFLPKLPEIELEVNN